MTSAVTTASDTTTGSTAVDGSTVADVLASEGAGTFANLLSMVGVDELTDAEQVTLFIPSDEALTSISADELSAIVDDPSLVSEVLAAHVVEGAVRSTDLQDGQTVAPVSGDDLPVRVDGLAIMIGDATVTKADIEFDGGVIHIIDGILVLPAA